jgi:capsular exopolysaccharide synthesis family protein
MANLITLKEPRSAAAEAYRVLRTNIQFARPDAPVKAFAITAPVADAGKPLAAANLAVCMAQAGESVILVDADLRRPSQHTIWQTSNEAGLASLMVATTDKEALPLQKTSVENLWLLPSGGTPPNPADLLGAKRMAEIITMLRARASYVIFDLPPVLAVSDAAVLGPKLDGVLLVIRAGSTRRDQAEQAKAALDRVHVPILGVALTNAPGGPRDVY